MHRTARFGPSTLLDQPPLRLALRGTRRCRPHRLYRRSAGRCVLPRYEVRADVLGRRSKPSDFAKLPSAPRCR